MIRSTIVEILLVLQTFTDCFFELDLQQQKFYWCFRQFIRTRLFIYLQQQKFYWCFRHSILNAVYINLQQQKFYWCFRLIAVEHPPPIYNSRNFIGALDYPVLSLFVVSTIVEILLVLQTASRLLTSAYLQQQKFYWCFRHKICRILSLIYNSRNFIGALDL